MAVSAARAAAFDILLRVEREDAYASELLHAEKLQALAPADHGLATELVMGVLRWRSWLDARIAEKSSQPLHKVDPEILTALRIAAYQLAFLSRVPARAAIHESVELAKRARKRSAAPFVNAVLRKLAEAGVERNHPGAAESAAELAAQSAHPAWLVERWWREFGPEATRQICAYDQRVPETSIRLSSADVEEELQADKIVLGPGKLLRSARRVISGDLTKTKAFREGRAAIQDEASQLVALLAGHGKKILDCCAAPGGKTRVLAQRNLAAEIVAVELHPHRARLLRKLVPEKNVQVVAADIRELPANAGFDRVLADVPCSGTGTLARNPEIKWKLQTKDLGDLQLRQIEILRAAMQNVAPGGRLVYSTCSLEPEENLEVVNRSLPGAPFRWLDCGTELKKMGDELVGRDLVSARCLRTLPGVVEGDGFFAAVLERVR